MLVYPSELPRCIKSNAFIIAHSSPSDFFTEVLRVLRLEVGKLNEELREDRVSWAGSLIGWSVEYNLKGVLDSIIKVTYLAHSLRKLHGIYGLYSPYF